MYKKNFWKTIFIMLITSVTFSVLYLNKETLILLSSLAVILNLYFLDDIIDGIKQFKRQKFLTSHPLPEIFYIDFSWWIISGLINRHFLTLNISEEEFRTMAPSQISYEQGGAVSQLKIPKPLGAKLVDEETALYVVQKLVAREKSAPNNLQNEVVQRMTLDSFKEENNLFILTMHDSKFFSKQNSSATGTGLVDEDYK